MISFKNFLVERRRNADNPAQARIFDAIEYLKKYANDPNIHITFTMLKKVGINPKSDFPDTPIAVYAYPLKEIWSDLHSGGIRNVPFAADKAKYLHVLRGNNITDISKYSKPELDRDMAKLESIVKLDSPLQIKDFSQRWGDGKIKSHKYFGEFWFKSMLLSQKGVQFSKKHMASWTNTLLKVGHNGFIDRGSGVIHPAEPTQSLFLSPRAYKVIDRIDLNKSNAVTYSLPAESRELLAQLKSGKKLPMSEVVKIISATDNPKVHELIANTVGKSPELIAQILLNINVRKVRFVHMPMFLEPFGYKKFKDDPTVVSAMEVFEKRKETA